MVLWQYECSQAEPCDGWVQVGGFAAGWAMLLLLLLRISPLTLTLTLDSSILLHRRQDGVERVNRVSFADCEDVALRITGERQVFSLPEGLVGFNSGQLKTLEVFGVDAVGGQGRWLASWRLVSSSCCVGRC